MSEGLNLDGSSSSQSEQKPVFKKRANPFSEKEISPAEKRQKLEGSKL